MMGREDGMKHAMIIAAISDMIAEICKRYRGSDREARVTMRMATTLASKLAAQQNEGQSLLGTTAAFRTAYYGVLLRCDAPD
jgi:hypothetical protein